VDARSQPGGAIGVGHWPARWQLREQRCGSGACEETETRFMVRFWFVHVTIPNRTASQTDFFTKTGLGYTQSHLAAAKRRQAMTTAEAFYFEPTLIAVTIEQQIAVIAPQVPSIEPNIAPVAPDIRQISRCLAKAPETQVAAEIAEVGPHIGAVTSDIEAICANVASLGQSVGAVSVAIPSGRSDRRGESGTANRRGNRKYQDRAANHDNLLLRPPSSACPLKRMRSEPRVCRGFIFGLCT